MHKTLDKINENCEYDEIQISFVIALKGMGTADHGITSVCCN